MDIGAVWSPTPAFFAKLTKKAMLELLAAECGAVAAENCTKMKKAELAEAICGRLPDGWLPAPILGTTNHPSSQLEGEETSQAA